MAEAAAALFLFVEIVGVALLVAVWRQALGRTALGALIGWPTKLSGPVLARKISAALLASHPHGSGGFGNHHRYHSRAGGRVVYAATSAVLLLDDTMAAITGPAPALLTLLSRSFGIRVGACSGVQRLAPRRTASPR